ncbi:hypothetical protein VU06_03350, partial [Desulfobulbus sp. F3]|nr:hypothetical protein [Desulfobulbus sp. F3]
MKKTKKVLSSIMLLVPLTLPAGCSPVSTAEVQGANQKNAQPDDEAEQLRLIVERYFTQQERQAASSKPADDTARQLQAATPQQQVEPLASEIG